jgi:hypothetical protein
VGEVIVNINERAAAVQPFGTFALTKPGASLPLPARAARIDLHSSKAKMGSWSWYGLRCAWGIRPP